MADFPMLLDRARLGAPISRKALTIVPIVAGDARAAVDYVPLPQALLGGRARLTEITEGGSVPLLAIKNDSDVAVFILDGEELVGAKQNRIVNLSILVPPRTLLPIPVSCVERGRWSYRTRGFDASPHVMFAMGRAPHMAAVTQCMSASGRHDDDQARVWRDVDGYFGKFATASPTAAMHDLYENRRVALDEVLADLRPASDQIGAIFALGGTVVGMELFESPTLFGTYFPKVARSYALDALVADAGGTFKFDEAEALFMQLRQSVPSRFKAIGLGEDLRIAEQNMVGGALVLGERLVHLAAFRHSPIEKPRDVTSPQFRPSWAPTPTIWDQIKRWFKA